MVTLALPQPVPQAQEGKEAVQHAQQEPAPLPLAKVPNQVEPPAPPAQVPEPIQPHAAPAQV